MVAITFIPGGEAVRVAVGTTVLAAARQAGLTIDAPCAGGGTCGKCKVRLVDGRVADLGGRHRLSASEQAAGWLLACTATVATDLTIELPQARTELRNIASHGREASVALQPWIAKRYDPTSATTLVYGGDALLAREAGDTTAASYGLAVDIGTTTLVVALLDLRSGRELAVASALNPQARQAQDVLSRIRLAGEPAGLAQLQQAVVAALNALIAETAATANVDPARIYEAVVSGNTCMLHLLAGVDPTPLGKYPYTPPLTGGCRLAAAEVGWRIAPCGQLYLPPVISAYVGADLTAGLHVTGLADETRSVLLVDIGTNGEMILARHGRLLAASTAAGPAFEGMNIACGMRAGAGAIERCAIAADGAVELGVIGGGTATGLCGSGLLDLVAELVRCGVVTTTGNFVPQRTALPAALQERLQQRDAKPVFAVDAEVWLGRGDIRQVQLAKGAIRAGIDVLLEQAGVTATELDAVLIAGSFGYHLRPESLLTLGLLPPECVGKIEFVGNTAKSGAQALLLHAPHRAELEAVAQRVAAVELATRPGFDKTFVACLGF